MIERSSNRTHVIWTFKSSGLNDLLIKNITDSDVDGVRLVAGDHDHKALLANARALRSGFEAQKKVVPVLVDPVKRSRGKIVNLKSKATLKPEQEIVLCPRGKGGDLEIDGLDWVHFFRDETLVFIGNGAATLMPEKISPDSVKARVVQGGEILPEMEVHCPLTRKPPTFSQIDVRELHAYRDDGIDGLVVQGFREAEDLNLLKKELRNPDDSTPWIILKVDSLHTYQNLAEFLPHVQGVLISRVELAMCMDPAKVPMVTKEIIQLCNDRAKIVVMASDILGSMRQNATPTRAEVSDIANAAMDGVDGIVLSEGLLLGRFAARGHDIAKRIIADIEGQKGFYDLNWNKHTPEINHTLAAITYAGYRAAHRSKAKAIVCLTNKGNTALLLASFRTNIPIFAITLTEDVLRRLAFIRGVHGLLLEDAPSIDEVLPIINGMILKDTWLKSGDKIVFVSVSLSSIGEKASNLFTVQTLH